MRLPGFSPVSGLLSVSALAGLLLLPAAPVQAGAAPAVKQEKDAAAGKVADKKSNEKTAPVKEGAVKEDAGNAATEQGTDEKAATEKGEAKPHPFKADNPYRKDVFDRAAVLAREVTGQQALALAYIKNGYGMIKAVELVEGNVSTAVQACGAEQPDLKADIEGRFGAWQEAIHPILDENRAAMDKAIDTAGFKDTKKVRAYLAAIDKAANHADSEMEKQVLSSPESCRALIRSMDETQGTLARLMTDVPWVPPAKAVAEMTAKEEAAAAQEKAARAKAEAEGDAPAKAETADEGRKKPKAGKAGADRGGAPDAVSPEAVSPESVSPETAGPGAAGGDAGGKPQAP